MNKEKQNKDLINSLIIVSESSSKEGIIPVSKTNKETVTTTLFKVLKENPYHFKQYDLFFEVHITQMKKNKTLKLDTYKLQRSELCSLFGWGIYGNEEGKLALIPSESKEYQELLNNNAITKKKAYNKNNK
jgi:hypothetical protein